MSIDASSIALVIEGGGTRNSYTAPLIQRLIRDRVDFGWAGGISAGTSLAVSYLSRDAQRAGTAFTDEVVDPRAGGLQSFLKGRGYFDAEYIYETSSMATGARPFNFAAFQQHPAQLGTAAVRADTGDTVRWSREDITDVGSLVKRVRASSTMPILMTMPRIDGIPYVDGALGESGGIPLDQAQAAGFTRFVVVRSRPRGYRRSPMKHVSFVRRAYKKYPAVPELMSTRHQRYNATCDRIDELEAAGSAYVFYSENLLIGNSERNLAKLKANFAAGQAQACRDYPAIMEFLSA